MIAFGWSLVLIISLITLIKASGYFTEASERIGLVFGLPAFIIGVTIVAVGTSLPELVSSIFAVLKGSSEIVVGNVIGSNITNIFLILGITAIISKKVKTNYRFIHVDLLFLVGSSLFLAATIWDSVFTSAEAVLCLLGLIIYSTYIVKTEREGRKTPAEEETEKEIKEEIKEEIKLEQKTLIKFIISMFFIYLGADYTIEAAIKISDAINIGKEVIALGAVAFGTSLPELVVSISAVRSGKPEIAVGNILGSNIFNTFAVMGIPAFIGTITIPSSILTFALPIMLIATLLYYFIIHDEEFANWEGWFLILFYLFFISKIFGLV